MVNELNDDTDILLHLLMELHTIIFLMHDHRPPFQCAVCLVWISGEEAIDSNIEYLTRLPNNENGYPEVFRPLPFADGHHIRQLFASIIAAYPADSSSQVSTSSVRYTHILMHCTSFVPSRSVFLSITYQNIYPS